MLALLLKPSACSDQGQPRERTWFRLWVSRILKMMLLWFFFGIALGASFGVGEGDLPGLLGFLVAGVIVLGAVGFLVGLLGAHWSESLAGAVAGCFAGMGIALLSGTPEQLVMVSTWLVMGGLMGATCPELWRRFRRVQHALAMKGQAAKAGVH